ncbi:MAG: hypothetical protein JNJ43_18575 [Anaerolineales bacterium]|nr:hypothetical protein [Anaerolineales bacterium]
MLQTIRDFGFGSLGLTEDDFLDTTNVIQIGQAPNRIDLVDVDELKKQKKKKKR